MFGISYGELFLIIGATAALIGPKDLPRIARTAGQLAGRSIGYIQMARGQFDSVMQQSQASQVHKELQDTMAQLEAIRYEIRSISIMNPAPFTRRMDSADPQSHNIDGTGANANGISNGRYKPVMDIPKVSKGQYESAMDIPKDFSSMNPVSLRLHSQATAYARLAESPSIKSGLVESGVKVKEESGDRLVVLPVSAENAGFLPKREGEPSGSDIVLEAILEADVARNAKQFFSQPENQIPQEITKE